MSLTTDHDARKPTHLAHISSALSIVAYTVVLVFFSSAWHFLFRSPQNGSRGMRRFLLIFTAIIFTNSTVALISTLVLDLVYPTINFFAFSPASINKNLCTVCWCPAIRQLQNICLILSIWAADGFMLWRCITFYGAVSKIRLVILKLVCAVLVMASVGIGLVYMIPQIRTDLSLTLFSLITLVINVVTTGLIAGRLIYYQALLQQAFGSARRSPYKRIVVLFCESAALVVAFNTVLLVLVLAHSDNDISSLVLLQMMAQIYAISPLMIIFKVAYDRVHHTHTSSFKTEDAQGVVDRDLRSLQFLPSESHDSTP